MAATPPAEATSAAGGWIGGAVVAAIAIAVIAVVVMIVRERVHRRRREALLARLAELEKIWREMPDVPIRVKPGAPPAAGVDSSGSTSEVFSPRGPLSTAISTIRHGFGPDLPGPDRVDLRSTRFIYDHLQDPLTPADLADGLNLSLRSLQRGLSGSLGCTPRELILAVKMREAKRRLLEDDLRVQEAARAVGYDDPFHFSRRFKAYYRVSPSEIQNRMDRSVA
jgi:AraC-like DNA-binding protein